MDLMVCTIKQTKIFQLLYFRLPCIVQFSQFNFIILLKLATHVLDEVSNVCCYLINYLKIINISRRPLPMLAIASFVNLKVLYISPHNINDDLVECFGKQRKYMFYIDKPY